jgi:hypothetical protein
MIISEIILLMAIVNIILMDIGGYFRLNYHKLLMVIIDYYIIMIIDG